MTPQDIAEACAAAMWAQDHANQSLGSRIDAIGPGHATLSMQVQPQHLNSHSICHGGYVFTLADSAFAYAANSHNQMTVAQQNQITYLSPANANERLTAKAVEVSRSGRSGIYDVTVTGADGRIVAVMRALSRQVKGQHIHEKP